MMRRIFLIGVYVLLGLILFVLAGPALAQDSVVTDDEVNEIAKDIYCPVCENTPLDVCATQACADWRGLIRTKLAEGQSPQEIFDYFARQYGDGVLANPPRRGVSLIILWVMPIVLVLLGALIFSRYLAKMRTVEPAAAAPSPVEPQKVSGAAVKTKPVTDDDYLSRVEQEVGKSK
jgi:cytochrome c-type biogenesis protein CcmH